MDTKLIKSPHDRALEVKEWAETQLKPPVVIPPSLLLVIEAQIKFAVADEAKRHWHKEPTS